MVFETHLREDNFNRQGISRNQNIDFSKGKWSEKQYLRYDQVQEISAQDRGFVPPLLKLQVSY